MDKHQRVAESTLISIVVPTLNEEENLREVYDRLEAVFASMPDFDFELIITDNHSDDATYSIAKQLASSDSRVRAFRFSRNFGYQRSIYAAYLLCSGAAAVQLDADLQDPPELIPKMLDLWQTEGAMVVYGVRTKREGETFVLTLMRRAFYRVVDWLSNDDLPRDAGDFRLLDRTMIEVLRLSFDATPYLRGAIAASGFKQVGIEYERDKRTRGQSKFGWRNLIGLAVDGIMNHSVKPLHLASVTAMVVATVAFIGAIAYVIGRFSLGQDWPAGFATLAFVQLIGILLNAVFLAIIGAYLGRMFVQLKSGPLVIIEEHEPDGSVGTALVSGLPIYQQTLAADQRSQEPDSI